MWGITHFMADALKFMFKEDYVPGKAHKFLFMWAPDHGDGARRSSSRQSSPSARRSAGASCSTRRPVCSQPVALQIAHLDIGLLFYFAISSLAVYGATLAGWASHNKWAMMGGLRASSQMMSYEVTMGMAVLGSFLVLRDAGAGRDRRPAASASALCVELGDLHASRSASSSS